MMRDVLYVVTHLPSTNLAVEQSFEKSFEYLCKGHALLILMTSLSSSTSTLKVSLCTGTDLPRREIIKILWLDDQKFKSKFEVI